MPKRLYLSCVPEGILCKNGQIGINESDAISICKNKSEFLAYLKKTQYDVCVCSSSMDWPEDYTDNKEIIDLCHAIRS